MKKLICYASGGLCNRIAPLLSCMAYKEKHLATELLICWEPTFRCFAEYTDIFEYPTDAKNYYKKRNAKSWCPLKSLQQVRTTLRLMLIYTKSQACSKLLSL